MTDEQIEKALHCIKGEELPCKDCNYQTRQYNCRAFVIADTIDYINRLKAEKEQAYKQGIIAVIGELKGESAIATYTFNSMLANELKTIYLRLEKEYGIEE